MTERRPTTIEALANEPAFDECPRQVLARALTHVHERRLEKDEALHSRGERADCTFYVLDGGFELAGEGDRRVGVESGFLGEEAAIGLACYANSAVATRPSTVLAFPRDTIWRLAETRSLRQFLFASFEGRFAERPLSGTASVDKPIAPAGEPIRLVVGWLLAILAPLAVLWVFWGSPTIPNDQALFLMAILSATIVMWIFRLIPDFVPAVFAVTSIVLLGLAPPEIALSGFASKSFFMALSIFGLSAVITLSGLSFRVLLWLLRAGPSNKVWYNVSLFLSGLVLTPVVPTANGRVAIVSPFLTDLLESFDRESAEQEAPRLSASLLGGASLMSAIFLSSKSVNFLVFGLLPFQEQMRFQWLYWLFAASVCGAILLVLYFLGCWLLFRNPSRPAVAKGRVENQLALLGPMAPAEWAGVFGLGILLASFLSAPFHHIDIPWVALAILFALLMFGFIGTAEFRQRIDWGFLVFLGSLIGLVASMRYVGLDAWLTDHLAWLNVFMSDDFPLFVLMLAAALFVVRLALPVNATVVIFATLLIPTAVNLQVNPWLVGFLILLLAESFIWPYQVSYYAQLCSVSGPAGKADHPRVLVLNFLVFGMKLAAIFASIPFWRSLGVL